MTASLIHKGPAAPAAPPTTPGMALVGERFTAAPFRLVVPVSGLIVLAVTVSEPPTAALVFNKVSAAPACWVTLRLAPDRLTVPVKRFPVSVSVMLLVPELTVVVPPTDSGAVWVTLPVELITRLPVRVAPASTVAVLLVRFSDAAVPTI